MKYIIALVIVIVSCEIASAATWWVRPDTDGNGTDLNYGLEDGTSFSNAFDGFADITGLSAGDTVCLPGSQEPFFERLDTPTAGTSTLPIIFKSCDSVKALIWSADGLSGNRSFDSSRAVVSTESYAWVNVGSGIWKKRIDVRPRMLWEGDTWLTPKDINSSSEVQILASLAAGEWGVRDNGDSTFRIYYKQTASIKTPLNTVIYCDKIDLSDGSPVGIVRADSQWNVFQDIEIRGHTASSQARSMDIVDTSNVTLRRVLFYRNQIGPSIMQTSASGGGHVWENVSVSYTSETGAYISPLQGLTSLSITGGSFSNTTGSFYNGSGFTAGDGDGIGIGQAGGTITDIFINGIDASYNANTGVFVGTASPMTVTNVKILASTFYGNLHNCFSEGTTSQISNELSIIGFICSDQPYINFPAIFIAGTAPAARTVTIANGVFTRNYGNSSIRFIPHANNNMRFYNLVFYKNGSFSFDRGDIWSNDAALIGDEVFKNIVFYSRPNTANTMSKLGSTTYAYTGAGFTAFNSATGHTGGSINTDPLLTSDTNYKLTTGSSLRRAGFSYNGCIDVRGRACWAVPDIGAYQMSSGDVSISRNTATSRTSVSNRSSISAARSAR